MTDNNPPGPKENGDGGDQAAAKEHSIAAAINALKAEYESAQHHQAEHERKVFLWTRRAAIGVFFYTVLTVIIAGAGIWQAWIARDTEHIGSRAYIAASAFQLINYGEKEGGHLQWTLRPIIENAGNTSPRGAQIIETVTGGPGQGWNFSSINKKQNFRPRVIAPHSQVLGSSIGFSVGLPRIMLPIVAAGIIKYRDIFDAPHLTEYCFDFVSFETIDFDNYPAGQAIRVSGDVSNPRCSKHNCEDEDCGADWEERGKE